MTFCECLKEETIGDITISAYKEIDKYESTERYVVYKDRCGVVTDYVKCAKSTWLKTWKKMAEQEIAKLPWWDRD